MTLTNDSVEYRSTDTTVTTGHRGGDAMTDTLAPASATGSASHPAAGHRGRGSCCPSGRSSARCGPPSTHC